MTRRSLALVAGASLVVLSLSHALAHVMPAAGAGGYAAALLPVAEPAGDEGHGHDPQSGAEAGDQVGALTITGAFARASVIDVGAAYLAITNTGPEDDRLVAVSSSMAERAELHEMVMDGDVMRMGEVEGGIPVPGGGSAALAPGRLHIMLLGLSGPLVEGETLPLTLRFEHAGEITLTVPILAPGASGATEGHAQH